MMETSLEVLAYNGELLSLRTRSEDNTVGSRRATPVDPVTTLFRKKQDGSPVP